MEQAVVIKKNGKIQAEMTDVSEKSQKRAVSYVQHAHHNKPDHTWSASIINKNTEETLQTLIVLKAQQGGKP